MSLNTGVPPMREKHTGKELLLVPLGMSHAQAAVYYLVYAEHSDTIVIALLPTLDESRTQYDTLRRTGFPGAYCIYRLVSARDGCPGELMAHIVAGSSLPDPSNWEPLFMTFLPFLAAYLETNHALPAPELRETVCLVPEDEFPFIYRRPQILPTEENHG